MNALNALITATETPPAEPLEETVRHHLATEDWYFSRTTRDWIERTPRHEAVGILLQIASDADLEPSNPWLALGKIITTSGFTPGSGLVGGAVRRRKAGIRAAILLSHLGEVRALAHLVRVFRADGRRAQSVYQELIEEAVLRLLANVAENTAALVAAADDLRQLDREIRAARNPSATARTILQEIMVFNESR